MRTSCYKDKLDKFESGFGIGLLLAFILILAIFGMLFYSRLQKPAPVVMPSPAPATNPPPAKPVPTNAPVLTNTPARSTNATNLAALPSKSAKSSVAAQSATGDVSMDQIPALLDSLWGGQKTDAQRERVRSLLHRWAEADPDAASRWVDSREDSPEQREASLAVATVWANQDIGTAVDWVKQWPEELQNKGLLSVGFEAARKSPKEALDLADSLEEGEGRDRLTLFALKQWAGSDSAAAVEWAGKLDDSQMREQAFADIAVALSEKDPVAAGRLALEKLEPGERQGQAVVSIVQRWAQSDPARAADWVGQFPKGELQNAALENLVQLWTGNNPAQTADWLNGLSDGGYRDHAIAIFSEKLVGSDPAAAANWAASIADPSQRQTEVERVLQRWKEIDPGAAEAWIRKK